MENIPIMADCRVKITRKRGGGVAFVVIRAATVTTSLLSPRPLADMFNYRDYVIVS